MAQGFEAADIDPVKLEIVRTGLQSIPDLIEADLMRTAFSPLIYEYKDYAVGLVDAEGRSIAQATQGLSLFTIVMGLAVKDGLETYGRARIEPGDVILTNYAGTLGQHLNNVAMYRPIFSHGRIVAFMVVTVHWIDIGGRYPGSCLGTDTTELIQEGLHLRSVKLYRRGELNEEVLRIIEYNTRLPDMLLGDIEAQYAGCVKGCQLFNELLARHGEDTVFAAIHAIWRNSEAAARAAVRAVPDATYRARSFLDNDGIDLDRSIPVDIAVHIAGDEFTVDFSNIGAQLRGPFNSGIHGGGETSARIAFKYLFAPDEPSNEGSFAPCRVVLPPGKFLSATGNAPLGGYSTPLCTVVDTIISALAPVLPERVAAGHHSSFGVYGFNGTDPRTKQYFNVFDTAHGGWGGSLHGDGVGPYKTITHADTKDIPVETIEALYPLAVERYAWRPDSAGAGRHRGGLGVDKVFRVLAPCHVILSFERSKCPPWGLAGGSAGEPGYAEVEEPDGARRVYHKVSQVPLAPGARVHIHSGSGGGYEPPIEREPDLVRRDVAAGYVSQRQAQEIYGVVLDARGEVDVAATRRRRQALAHGMGNGNLDLEA
ncbi:MAG TPA: hydantoinase B/oxoprolinase family protein [Stellaceae bacterium]|nr:hydantoinase B/oxoprolinase family protein [Stellaceae bacterium]